MKKFLFVLIGLLVVSMSAEAQYPSFFSIYVQTAYVDSLLPRGTSGRFGWLVRNASPHTAALSLAIPTDTVRFGIGYFSGQVNGFTLRQGATLSDTSKYQLTIANLADTAKYVESTDLSSGTLTIGAGDSVQVALTGLTIATGVAWATYKTTAASPADTVATYNINTADKITLYGKFGWKVGYGIIKK